jgi:RNA polymerase sigma-70 factor (ECF subfamily)
LRGGNQFRRKGSATENSVNVGPDELLNILERDGPELHALLTRLTLRADVAEDLLQDLFLKLRTSDGFARATNRKGYAFRTAIHLACDWRRARRETGPLAAETVGKGAAPLSGLIDAEELEQVLDALPQLSALSREVLVLHFLQHQEYAEIAEQIGKTVDQVRGLCHKAIRRLRLILPPTADEAEKRVVRP